MEYRPPHHTATCTKALDLCGGPKPGADWQNEETAFERGSVRPLSLRPGRRWRELLDGSRSSIRGAVVIENDEPTTGLQVRALVTATHRLAMYPGTAEGELFDRRRDPDEVDNLWARDPALHRTLTEKLLHAYSLHTPAFLVPASNA
jgi:hypothetical protein